MSLTNPCAKMATLWQEGLVFLDSYWTGLIFLDSYWTGHFIRILIRLTNLTHFGCICIHFAKWRLHSAWFDSRRLSNMVLRLRRPDLCIKSRLPQKDTKDSFPIQGPIVPLWALPIGPGPGATWSVLFEFENKQQTEGRAGKRLRIPAILISLMLLMWA